MLLLSIFGILLSMLVGYLYPRKMAWLIFSLAPILGPTRFTPVPSEILPLNVDRIAFSLTLGIVLRYVNLGFPLKKILQSKVFLSALIFCFIYFFVGFNERYTIFTYLPNMFYAFTLTFIIIRDERDFYNLLRIFYIHTIIITFFIFIEYFTQINVGLLLQKTNPTVDETTLYTPKFYEIMTKSRGGQLRVAGLFGNPINTGFRMAFLLPIALWYSLNQRLYNKLLFVFILIAFLLLQTRMAIIAFVLSIIIMLGKMNMRILLKFVLTSTFVFMILYLFPFTNRFIHNFWESSFSEIFRFTDDPYTASRIAKLYRAFLLFLDNPILGYGSPKYVYYDLMETHDINSPLIYLLSGGILFFSSYSVMVISILISIYKTSKRKFLSKKNRELLSFLFGAFFGGFIVVLSSWSEDHFLIMFMMYMAIYKVFIYNKRFQVYSMTT